MRSYCFSIFLSVGLLLSQATPFKAQAKPATAASQTLPVTSLGGGEVALMQGDPAAWKNVPAKRVALNRTPPLFDTDEPAADEIASVDIRCARDHEKLIVQLNWHDATHDADTLEKIPGSPPETRFHKVPSEESDRFFDAAAIMFPSKPAEGDQTPSLQMGDAGHPVQIYYWNGARGAMKMEAQGRETTRRTGESFPATGSYQSGNWTVVFELPDLHVGTPLAFAVWNGSQKDRDGRKYFSVWQILQ